MQPSEFMKICIILSLAKFFDEKKIKEKRDYFFLILPLSLVLFPFGLIISQPDLGTASMILFISFLIFFISGLSWKFFASLGVGFLIIAPSLWNSLKNYQKQRILTLFNPENDPLGSGYHIIQSQIAIGFRWYFWQRMDERNTVSFRFFARKTYRFYFFNVR